MAKWIYKFVPAKPEELDKAGEESWEAVTSDGKNVLMKKQKPVDFSQKPVPK